MFKGFWFCHFRSRIIWTVGWIVLYARAALRNLLLLCLFSFGSKDCPETPGLLRVCLEVFGHSGGVGYKTHEKFARKNSLWRHCQLEISRTVVEITRGASASAPLLQVGCWVSQYNHGHRVAQLLDGTWEWSRNASVNFLLLLVYLQLFGVSACSWR